MKFRAGHATPWGPGHELRVPRWLRRDRRRRRPRRLRGRAGRGAHGRARARADRQPRDGRADVVQPGDRRRREGPPRQGDRRARRRDGERDRRRPASSSAGSTRARGRRCARRARRPTSAATATRCGCGSSAASGSRCARARSRSSASIDDERRATTIAGVTTTMGVALPRARRDPDDRHVPARRDLRRRGARGGRARRRGARRSGCRTRSPSSGSRSRGSRPGTPCRLDRKTIDVAGLELQPGDDPPPMFRWTRAPARPPLPQVPCWVTYTNERTHADRSATACRARRCTARRSRAPGRATARASRTRSSGSRTRTATRSSSSPRASRSDWRRGRGLSERHLDVAAVRRPARVPAHDPRPRARRDDAAGLRRRVRLHRSARGAADARDAPRARASTTPARSTARSGYEEAAIQGLLAGINAALALGFGPAIASR